MNIKQGKLVRLGAAALVVGGLLLGTLTSAGAASAAELARYGGPTGRTTAPATGTLWQTPAAPLDAAEMAALIEAINEEYGALNTYRAVLSQFGSVMPFSRIVRCRTAARQCPDPALHEVWPTGAGQPRPRPGADLRQPDRGLPDRRGCRDCGRRAV